MIGTTPNRLARLGATQPPFNTRSMRPE